MICLICKEKLVVFKEYNLNRHYATKHGEHYENYKGNDRKNEPSSYEEDCYPSKNFSSTPIRKLMLQLKQVTWSEAGKSFTEGQFLKICMLIFYVEYHCDLHCEMCPNICHCLFYFNYNYSLF